ncbi:MFS transporter [uncultured Shimia sp.]|uniref:MFS transporter n=1 Tax=uncultured Shimia sp. TaxID=573152 RepID=UPI00261DD6F1|nr:MFS transporter [uncultured Shimia sp.]
MSSHKLSRTDTVIFMGGITALTAVSVDIVLPTTAVVARYFGVDPRYGAMLVGVYFIAYAIGQLFWGLFSDAFGRRRALILSLSGFTVASLACALAPSFQILIAARFIQGLMGGAPVIARAMVRDVAEGNEAARMMTVLGAILTIGTMFAPVLGSGLLVLFSWRAIFVSLTILGLVFLAYTLKVLPETGGQRRPERFSFGFLVKAGAYLFTNSGFLVPMIAGGLTFGGYAGLMAVSAIITETVYGVEPEAFGALFALAALVNTGGALLAGQLLKRISLRQVGSVAMVMLAVAAAVNLLTVAISPSLQVFWGVVCLYVLCFGIILPTSYAAAMEPAKEMPGFAASVMGAGTMIIGSFAAMISSSLYDGTHMAANLTMGVFGAGAVLTVVVGRYLRLK